MWLLNAFIAQRPHQNQIIKVGQKTGFLNANQFLPSAGFLKEVTYFWTHKQKD